MWRLVSVLFLFGGFFGAAFVFFDNQAYEFEISNLDQSQFESKEKPALPPAPAKPKDIAPQQPLPNPPQIIKAVYATSWSANSEPKLKYLINLIKETELNAIVIDVKDYSGYIAYNTELELPRKYNAMEERIPALNKLIKRLHDNGIYVIGRISIFQDQRLALARPDLALTSSSTGKIWGDNKGLAWMDTASQEVWDYNIEIAREILTRGFDEANFDYIRFASDGKLNDIIHPIWNEKTLKTHVVRDFFQYLRERLPNDRISADLFGLVTVNTDGLGIGQHLEFAWPNFDAIAPMVYPSHYFKGFIGIEKPAEHPYEIIKYSMEAAIRRIINFEKGFGASTTPPATKLRPWLQDFDLGADYDAEMVLAQIQAVNDAASTTGRADLIGGWMLWNPSNIYTREALKTE